MVLENLVRVVAITLHRSQTQLPHHHTMTICLRELRLLNSGHCLVQLVRMRALIDSLRSVLAVSSALMTIYLDVSEVWLLTFAASAVMMYASRLARLLALELVRSFTLVPRLSSLHAVASICVLELLYVSFVDISASQVLALKEVILVLLELLLTDGSSGSDGGARMSMPDVVAHEETSRLKARIANKLSVRRGLALTICCYVCFDTRLVLHVEAREDSVTDALQVVHEYVLRGDANGWIKLIRAGKSHTWRVDVETQVLRRVLVARRRPLHLRAGRSAWVLLASLASSNLHVRRVQRALQRTDALVAIVIVCHELSLLLLSLVFVHDLLAV